MDKTISKMAANPRHVPGIYNYCDRWCERCNCTSLCLEYEMLSRKGIEGIPDDLDNKLFWDELASTLESALQMLKEIADEQGIPPADTKPQSDKVDEDIELTTAREDVLAVKAADYLHAVDEWFRSEGQALQSMGHELAQAQSMELPGMHLDADAGTVNDCLEVIQWYRFQIHVKLVMALMNEDPDDTGDQGFGLKPEGIAKVALIGIDRSIAAWAKLREHLPECADSILDMLVNVDRLRRLADARFPNARAFIRPGLDEKKG